MIRRTFLKALMASPLGFLICDKLPAKTLQIGPGSRIKGKTADMVYYDDMTDPLGAFVKQVAENHSRLLDDIILKAINRR